MADELKAATSFYRQGDILHTRGLYYTVPNYKLGILGSPEFNDPNFTSQPINLNNSGFNDRKLYDAALKLSYNMDGGTFSSITGYSTVWEILTGDGYPFDPFGPYPINRIGFNFDQAQFLTVQTLAQFLLSSFLTAFVVGRFGAGVNPASRAWPQNQRGGGSRLR